MTLLDRYILREHLWPFVMAFFVVMFILVIDLLLQMLDLIIGKSVSVLVVGQLFLFNLAWMVALAIPMTVLVAVLMAWGQLAHANEVSAMKAGGVSLYRMAIPVIIASVLIAVGLVAFNDRILPEANHRARALLVRLRQMKPSLMLYERAGQVIDDLDGYSLLYGGVDRRTDELEGVVLYQRSDTAMPTLITARKAGVEMDNRAERITFTLKDGELHRIDQTDPTKYLRTHFQRLAIRIDNRGRGLGSAGGTQRGDREMNIRQMRESTLDLAREVQMHRVKMDSLTQILSSTSDSSRHAQLLIKVRGEESIIGNYEKGIKRYLVEVHKKFAIPIACPVFVLVGLPLAIRTRRGGMTIGFGMALGFFLIYWAFLMGGEQLADRGYIEPWLAMWQANILLGGAGLWLFFRAV